MIPSISNCASIPTSHLHLAPRRKTFYLQHWIASIDPQSPAGLGFLELGRGT